MKFLKYFILIFYIVFSLSSIAQEKHVHQEGGISGTILGLNADGETEALPFANVYWSGTTLGVVADDHGHFDIATSHESHYLVFSFLGYVSDSLHMHGEANDLQVVLMPNVEQMEGVEISQRVKGSFVSKINPIHSEHITTAGLQRLACCNLSESFENNATVDVGFADAVSGAKQIRMLGLDGKYSQIMLENIPSIRGLASKYGLSYIPGSWMQSIQVSKGSSSIVSGFESVTGQINVELKKPQLSDPLHINVYGNSEGRAELNAMSAVKLNEKLSTMLFLSASGIQTKHDKNKDGFLDVPLQKQINLLNRWNYEIEHKLHMQLLVNYLYDEREGGQLAYYDFNDMENPYYGMNANTNRLQVISKSGFIFGNEHNQSLGIQLSGTWHKETSVYGERSYKGEQLSFYSNLVYLLSMDDGKHQISLGGGVNIDDYQQQFNDSVFNRTETVPGVFGEYTLKPSEAFTLILGGRYDYQGYYEKSLLSPRMHMKYGFAHHTSLRASIGRSYRSAVIFPENAVLMASNRQIVITEAPRLEEAWNYGFNITHDLSLSDDRELTLSFDFYRTDFQNQVIADIDQSAHSVIISNLDGHSFANNVQAGISGELFRGLEATIAFRYSDVEADFHGERLDVPFVNRYKGLLSFSWKSSYDKWQIDLTNQFQGDARLPYTGDNPIEYQLSERSPAYVIVHAQITRNFKNWSVYLGGENLTDYTQEYPILAADDPFGPYFDASMIWGPVMGRMFYAGIRYNIY